MRVTLNIWSLLCPLSPLLSLSLPLIHTLGLPLSPELPQTKGSLKLCPDEVKISENKRALSKLFVVSVFFPPRPSSFDKLMSTVSEKGTEQPVSRWQNVNPAETSSGRSTGLSAVLIPRSFVLRRSADVCSSFSRSLLSPRAEEQKRQHILTSHTSQMDGHQCADNELHACVIIKERFCPLFDLVSKRSCSIFFFFCRIHETNLQEGHVSVAD